MTKNEKDKFIIERYENDEKMMVLIFAQWCVNRDVDPFLVYERAYPNQTVNELLKETVEETVPEEESEEISTESLQHVLQLFGNDDLAFVVQQVEEESQKRKN